MCRLCVVLLALGLTACDVPEMGGPGDADGGDWGPMTDGGFPLGDETLRIDQMQMRATVNSYHDFVFGGASNGTEATGARA